MHLWMHSGEYLVYAQFHSFDMENVLFIKVLQGSLAEATAFLTVRQTSVAVPSDLESTQNTNRCLNVQPNAFMMDKCLYYENSCLTKYNEVPANFLSVQCVSLTTTTNSRLTNISINEAILQIHEAKRTGITNFLGEK